MSFLLKLSLSIFFFNVYLFLGKRETEHERERGRERGRHRIGNRLQALSHQPRAQRGARRGARTHGPRDRDLAEVGRLTDCATQAPLDHFIFKVYFIFWNKISYHMIMINAFWITLFLKYTLFFGIVLCSHQN